MAKRDAKQVLRACANGGVDRDWREFQSLFESRIRGGVRRALRRAGRGQINDEVDDFVQETYCKLLERNARVLARCKSDDELGIGVYLGRVAERVTLDRLRAETAAKRGGGRVDSLEAVGNREGDRAWPTVEADAERRVLRQELRRRFLSACCRVAGRSRERNTRILWLAFMDGLSSREISERLGEIISIAGIDTVLHRARGRLVAQGFLCGRRPLARESLTV